MKNGWPERWKPIPGYEGLYRVSSRGRVYSYHSERMLKSSPARDRDGYTRLVVGLSRDGINKTPVTARVVLLAFVGPPPEGKPYAAHWDGNSTNNYLWNLRWASGSEQKSDDKRNGVALGKKKLFAVAEATRVREEYRELGCSQKDLALRYGVSHGTINNVITQTKAYSV